MPLLEHAAPTLPTTHDEITLQPILDIITNKNTFDPTHPCDWSMTDIRTVSPKDISSDIRSTTSITPIIDIKIYFCPSIVFHYLQVQSITDRIIQHVFHVLSGRSPWDGLSVPAVLAALTASPACHAAGWWNMSPHLHTGCMAFCTRIVVFTAYAVKVIYMFPNRKRTK